MDKSLNLKLVFLLLFVIVLLVGVTLYFHDNLDSYKAKYQETERELKFANEQLDLLSESHNKTLITLSVKEQREDDISGKYTDVKETNKELEVTKNKLSSDLSSTKNTLKATQDQNKVLISRNVLLESALEVIKTYVTKAMADVEDAKDARGELDDLQESVEGPLPSIADSMDDEIGALSSSLNDADDALDGIMGEILEVED